VSEEVVVRIDGLPRPATVVERGGADVLVRYRHAGEHVDRWVPAADVVEVEAGARLPVAKLVGLVALAVLGLLLLLWPGGSDRPLIEDRPAPTATAS
jgi:hypothetical protein